MYVWHDWYAFFFMTHESDFIELGGCIAWFNGLAVLGFYNCSCLWGLIVVGYWMHEMSIQARERASESIILYPYNQ